MNVQVVDLMAWFIMFIVSITKIRIIITIKFYHFIHNHFTMYLLLLGISWCGFQRIFVLHVWNEVNFGELCNKYINWQNYVKMWNKLEYITWQQFSDVYSYFLKIYLARAQWKTEFNFFYIFSIFFTHFCY